MGFAASKTKDVDLEEAKVEVATMQDYPQLREEAEDHFQRESYTLALRAYERAALLELGDSERKWVQFRLADAGWRALAASKNPDPSALEAAHEKVEEFLATYERPEQQDDLWALAQESLGDFAWLRPQSRSTPDAWGRYQSALDYWAASAKIDLARARYLGIMRKMVEPPNARDYERSNYVLSIQESLLLGAQRIALTVEDKAWTHYCMALRGQHGANDERTHERTKQAFESVLELGAQTSVYADALYTYGVWLEEHGELQVTPEQQVRTVPDYKAAVVVFERLLKEYAEGTHEKWRSARDRVRKILGEEISVRVNQVFLPGSAIGFGLRWRNVHEVHFALHPVDLTTAVQFTNKKHGSSEYLGTIDLDRHPAVQKWDFATGDVGRHDWGDDEHVIEGKLEPGAYVLQARAGGASSRELILVSDAGLVVKSQQGKLVAWFADVFTGEPIEGARLKVWAHASHDSQWELESRTTAEDGLVRLDLEETRGRWREYFIAASDGKRQAFVLAHEPWRNTNREQRKIYASADRAAYRPEQRVFWKVSMRLHRDGTYSTPAGEKLMWELANPLGEVLAKDVVTLNEFGSAAGSLTPTSAWALGEYGMNFYAPGKSAEEHGEYYGSAKLFRLEEYKLPEFLVTVERPLDDGGRPKEFRMGDIVEMSVRAEYYFGGPVADATAEVRLYRSPFYKTFVQPREFPWLHADSQPNWRWNGGPGELVRQETLRTDAEGRLVVQFETSKAESQDYEYTVEALITDSSRREVQGQGTLRVTHQAWFAHLSSSHNIHAPGQAAELELFISDADDRPLEREGQVTLVQLTWKERWIHPSGRIVEGLELGQLKSGAGLFPPNVAPGQLPWRLQSAEYEESLVSTSFLKTDAQGKATWKPQLPQTGHYVVRFVGTDRNGVVIRSEVALECINDQTSQIGLAVQRSQLLLDKDTFREGEPGLVMIATPASGRWVLFAIETDELLEYRVVHVEGTVKLLRLQVDETWVPNVYLTLFAYEQGEATTNAIEVIVPAEKHFLGVEVELDPVVSKPGDPGTMRVHVTDHDGKPVRTELTLSLVDAAIAAIQEDYAGDPREFFYGEKRAFTVQTANSTDSKPYRRMLETKDGRLQDADSAQVFLDEEDRDWGERASGMNQRLRGLGYAGGASGSDDFYLGMPVSRTLTASGEYAPGRDAGAFAKAAIGGLAGAQAPGSAEVIVAVRKNFQETALWLPAVVTDDDGQAVVPFTYPDNLTRWSAKVRAQSSGADFGTQSAESATRLPLLVRLQAPRFFVVGDEAVVSLNLDNRTDEAMDVQCRLDISGLDVLGFVSDGVLQSKVPERVTLPAQDGVRLDWKVRATSVGEARFAAEVKGAEFGDAIERELPVHEHGIEVLLVKAGRFEGEGVDVVLELPAARADGTTHLQVQVTPSMAVTMLDALPYLVDYPYGCTEQTLSRFVPTAVVKRTLEKLGLNPDEAMSRVFGGIEAQFVDKTQRKTQRNSGDGLRGLAQATEAGLARLYDLQHGDGSWSWWKHGDGDRFMTAYVVWGLSLAKDAGVDVDESKLSAAAHWLGKELVSARKDANLQAWMLHAHSAWLGQVTGEQREFALSALRDLMAQRATIGAYGRALICLSAVALGQDSDARLLVENLIDGVIRDEAPDASIIPVVAQSGGTQSPRTHWGEDGVGYRWSDGGVEATAFALRALVAVDPKHELVEPAADWLSANRRGAQWSNTKTTSIVVLALSDYLEKTQQLARDVEFEVVVNGNNLGRKKLEAQDLLSAPSMFAVPTNSVVDGANRVQIRRLSGEGPLFFSAEARFFSLEEPIPPHGNELFVRRQYFKLVPQPTLLRGTVYERVLMKPNDEVVSGQRIEVVLTVEAKNHLEYLMFEDLKPAGLEATQVKSGEHMMARELRGDEVQHRMGGGDQFVSGRGERAHNEVFDEGYTGRTRELHQELRDRKVTFFLDQCPEGVWEIRYDLRAESPGVFHALPLLGEAMYVPEIRANGAESLVQVNDRADV